MSLPAAERALAQGASGRDSVAALASAQQLLRSFEQRWRTEIASQVFTPSSPLFALCEQRIGTDYCYGPNNGRVAYSRVGTAPNADRFAPDVVPRFARRRARSLLNNLLDSLRQVRTVIPGDQWIAGQLVRLNLERGQPLEALDEAIECTSERWWCGALRGHVLHLLGVEPQADSVWTSVLYALPLRERCLWLDPTDVIRSDSLRREVSQMDCASQAVFAERLWWLSDPLYLTAGNERRSEHLSRQVALLLDWFSNQRLDSVYVDMVVRGLRQVRDEQTAADAGSAGAAAGPARRDVTLSHAFRRSPLGYEELVRRLGVPGYFQGTRPEDGSSTQLVALYPQPRYSFVPSAAALSDHSAAVPADWQVIADRPYEFQVSSNREFVELDYQVGFFRRGDSTRVVAASDLSLAPRLARGTPTAALVIRRDISDSGVVLLRRVRGDTYMEEAIIPSGRTFVSMEVLSQDGSVAGRVRFGSGLPDVPNQRVAVSDPLLTYLRARPPEQLDDARLLMLGSRRISRGAQVGVFWEVYGLERGERYGYSVVVTRPEDGFLTRLGQTLIGSSRGRELGVDVDDRAADAGLAQSRGINLDLSSLEVGRYVVSIEIRAVGEAPVKASTHIEVLAR
jgi:hypothetical protein